MPTPQAAAKRAKSKITLASVILRFRTIANDRYQGKVYDNALAIFNQLSTVEKRILLRGLMGICFIVENKILSEADTMRSVKDALETTQQTITNDVEAQLEVQNQKQLISMKGWLFKFISGTLIVVLVGSMILSYLATGKVDFLDKFKWIGDAAKLIFGI